MSDGRQTNVESSTFILFYGLYTLANKQWVPRRSLKWLDRMKEISGISCVYTDHKNARERMMDDAMVPKKISIMARQRGEISGAYI